MSDYGELLNANTVRFERLLPGPIERVWGYLVDSDKRAKWLCGGNTDSDIGGKVEMHFHNASLSSDADIERPAKYNDMPEKVCFSGTVTRYEPPRVLAHTWVFDDQSSEVCYELEEQDDKVRLVLTHTRLNSGDEVLSVCGGWHTHLDILVDVLNGREPRPFWKTQTQLEAQYEQRLSQ
ncbi:MAG: SRPBCC family protein [Gammaproteobacteria bacterium]|nr:SRPBCC family protein [Gammaproteobacteria bacterium]MDH3431321.1 SRPBCC family protein [Gammaproteobacteria bacterium]MDH3435201.1 SRPBCC family protein [Gammaproteobacteria bacterium]